MTVRAARFIGASWISSPCPRKEKTDNDSGAVNIQQVKSTPSSSNRVSPHWCEMLQARAQSILRSECVETRCRRESYDGHRQGIFVPCVVLIAKHARRVPWSSECIGH